MTILSHSIYRDGGTLRFTTKEGGPYFIYYKAGQPTLKGSVWKGAYPEKGSLSEEVLDGAELVNFVSALLNYPNIQGPRLERILVDLQSYTTRSKSPKSIKIDYLFNISSEDLKDEKISTPKGRPNADIFEESEIAVAIIRRQKEIETYSWNLQDGPKALLDQFCLVWVSGPLHVSRIPNYLTKHLNDIRAEEDPEYATYLRLKKKFNGR